MYPWKDDGSQVLAVSHGVVRWVRGSECGIEFIRINPDEQGTLQRIIDSAKDGAITESEEILT